MDKKLNSVSSSKYKTCVPDIFFETPLNTVTQIIMDTMACPLGVCINQVPLYCLWYVFSITNTDFYVHLIARRLS